MTRSRARITGAVYLLYFVTVIFAVSLIGHVPAAYSDAANLIANAIYLVVTVLLYRMFRPVNPKVASLAVAISVVGCFVQSLSLFHLAPPQSSLPIFGLFNLTIGYLILRSTFLPRVLGILMALSAWLALGSVARPRTTHRHVHRDRRRNGGRMPDGLAPRDGPQRSALERNNSQPRRDDPRLLRERVEQDGRKASAQTS